MVDVEEYRNRRIRRVGRIWGTVIIAYVVLIILGMVISLITEGEADPNSEDDIEIIEYSGPVLVFLSTAGLAIAWKKEGIGGSITVACQVLFLILLPFHRTVSFDLRFMFPLLISLYIMVPGILFIAYCKRTRNE